MKRLTKRDEYGNADIIGVDSEDLQLNLSFDEFNKVTAALNKLADYEDLREQGLLLKLPCRVGDTLYVLTEDSPDGIEETKCQSIVLNSNTKFIVYASCQYDDWGNAKWRFKRTSFGKTVFLTQAEAEEALKKMEE